MKPLFEKCYDCKAVGVCASREFSTCLRIEYLSREFGLPAAKKEDESYIKLVPFGVKMALKHMLQKINADRFVKNPIINGMNTNGDVFNSEGGKR